MLIDGYGGKGPGPTAGTEMEDLDLTVLAWPEFHGVDTHVNAEVDVVTVVLSGQGEAVLDGTRHELTPGQILVIPKGTERSIRSLSAEFRYVNVHKRRRRLMPQLTRREETSKLETKH
jgi:mannose-6-phosphate isomerase-like protein (cupin superfamily)